MIDQKLTISVIEFQEAWIKCLAAMCSIVMEKGYEGLTLINICERSGIAEKKIIAYFLSLEILLKMHDEQILLEQTFKTQFGKEKTE